jgi:hypothetical protein
MLERSYPVERLDTVKVIRARYAFDLSPCTSYKEETALSNKRRRRRQAEMVDHKKVGRNVGPLDGQVCSDYFTIRALRNDRSIQPAVIAF